MTGVEVKRVNGGDGRIQVVTLFGLRVGFKGTRITLVWIDGTQWGMVDLSLNSI